MRALALLSRHLFCLSLLLGTSALMAAEPDDAKRPEGPESAAAVDEPAASVAPSQDDAAAAAAGDAAPSSGDEDATDEEVTEFLRLLRDGSRLEALQTAIVRYTLHQPGVSAPLVVDLIGAVHVGERDYYRRLNKQFEQYEALLYELVAEEEMRVPPPGARSNHPVGAVQNGLTDILGLEHQLAGIDYSRQNFVHADMSPEEFVAAMANRNDSFLAMFFRMMGAGLVQQSLPGATGDADMLMAFFSSDREMALRRMMAQQFEDLEGVMVAFEGPDGSTIISDRNQKAIEVLAEQIEAGKRHLGIFYGAGHMPDLERRLREQFGLERESVEWLTAWRLQRE